MKILITGSREWMDEDAIRNALIRETVIVAMSDVVVIHGGAVGADTIAGLTSFDLGFAVRRYPANWTRYGDAAGPIRNLQMLVSEHANRDLPPIDVCLAFPLWKSRGTHHMMHWAKLSGIRVVDLGR